MLNPSEEVTRSWATKKGVLLKTRPHPSRFSFGVCLAIVLSLASGFLGGFITAGFAISDNYSAIYEALLSELESARECVDHEKNELQKLRIIAKPQYIQEHNVVLSHRENAPNPNPQIHEQAIFSVFSHAMDLLEKNNKNGACNELKNILNIDTYNGEWKNKSLDLFNKNCI